MDARLNREFVHVHPNISDLGERTVSELMELNNHGCRVTQHAGTISIGCQSLCGLGNLAGLCTDNQEGPDPLSGLRAAIVKFIG